MNKRRQRGANLVEAALTLLVLFIFIFGIIEFGRIYNIYQAITNAAREGARFAVAPCPTLGGCSVAVGPGVLPPDAAIKDRVRLYLNSMAIRSPMVADGDIVITQINQPVNYGGGSVVNTTYTRVQITAHYQFLAFPFGNLPITSDAVMRNETN